MCMCICICIYIYIFVHIYMYIIINQTAYFYLISCPIKLYHLQTKNNYKSSFYVFNFSFKLKIMSIQFC